ncbi:MAG: radical SAM protein [Candidatus Aenigmarchaeota archaeon]|nr:radical SAM protein [Candidatus Aenigmarchaeota archaeon]
MKKTISKNICFGYGCNNNCLHCIIGYGQRKQYRDLTTGEVKAKLDLLVCEGIGQVIFIGGEVAIRNDFFELLEYAKDKGLKVHIETNGRVFCKEAYSKRFLEIMPEASMMISFHSATPSIHDSITQVSGSFEQSVRGIRNLKKYGLKHLQINCVVSKLNYFCLEENLRLFKGLGANEVHFTLMRVGGNAIDNLDRVFVPIREIRPHLIKALELGKELGVKVLTYGFPYCVIPKHEQSVFEKNFLETFRLGATYIFDEPTGILDWQKERISMKAKPKDCRRCKLFGICEGVWKEYLTKNLLEKELVPQ